MYIFFIKRKWFLIAAVLLVAVGMALLVKTTLTTSGRLYQKHQGFPPLVYLPGYQEGPKVYAGAAILIECQSGAIMYAKNHLQRRAPASTTKMMTAIVALEKGDLQKTIKVSRLAAGTPGSSIWLRPGDQLSLKELLEGMMICSGNDGSMAVAEGVAGSVASFVALMNLKAKEIGALHTNFMNPHGLRAPSHYTTALDLALIARYAMGKPFFARVVSKKNAVLEFQKSGKSMAISNTNRLLWYLEGADGVKTGTTNEAGYCLVASATRDGRRLITVALNSGDRWGDCARMLEYGFKEFQPVALAKTDQPFCRLKIGKSKVKWINLYPRSNLVAVIRKNSAHLLETKVTLYQKEPVKAPLRTGTVLGKIDYRYQGQIIEHVDLINRRPVKADGWFW